MGAMPKKFKCLFCRFFFEWGVGSVSFFFKGAWVPLGVPARLILVLHFIFIRRWITNNKFSEVYLPFVTGQMLLRCGESYVTMPIYICLLFNNCLFHFPERLLKRILWADLRL